MPVSVYEHVREFVSQCKCAYTHPQFHASIPFPPRTGLPQDPLFQDMFALLPSTLPLLNLTSTPASIQKMLCPLVLLTQLRLLLADVL